MRFDIQVDDGDEIAVQALSIVGQKYVRLDFTNKCHSDAFEFDWLTLSADQARDLARALLCAAENVQTKKVNH